MTKLSFFNFFLQFCEIIKKSRKKINKNHYLFISINSIFGDVAKIKLYLRMLKKKKIFKI